MPATGSYAYRFAALLLTACMLWLMSAVAASAQNYAVSPAPTLQWFEATYETIEWRTADAFLAGYGSVWLPPTNRADSGNQSVGYDVYDRFDLGSPGNPTLYGTETGLKAAVQMFQRSGGSVYLDFMLNHNGFRDMSTPGFLEQGGYPGFVVTHPDAIDGDFWGAYESGVTRERLAGLISINHGTNFRYIRNPVPGFANNIPGGTIANVPTETNRRFYPDTSLDPIIVFDPATGESDIHIYPFNLDNPMAGDPVEENALGYLMRNAQWLVQSIGVDGFRLDAAKHVEPWVFNYFDRAVYRSSNRHLLDGSTRHVFSFSEVFDGDHGFQQQFIRKDIDPFDIGRVGGNRDVLDFPQYFALRDNLTGDGFANNWHNVVNAGMDVFDDGFKNGSAGVMFVDSHDDNAPFLSNVAHAYMLMHPGNAVVYFNAKEHGDFRDFPKDGRGDALGGVYGDTVTTLVNIRNTHGRGNYIERWINEDYLAFERESSAVVMLSNRNDAGVSDWQKIYVNLPWGTHLVELTGNHAHDDLIPELVTVDDDFFAGPTYINARFLNNAGQDHGYLVYGLATPQSPNGIELSNVAFVLQGGNPAPNDFENGKTRLADLPVIEEDNFQMQLATQPVYLLGSIRDKDADGDNALFRFNEGLDINGINPHGTISGVDYDEPGSVAYGFEHFTTVNQPGYHSEDGHGLYVQDVDTTLLPEGMNFITVRVFRHRSDGGPPVYEDFRQVIYVDRLPPESGIAGFEPITSGINENRRLVAQSLDLTADNIHVLLNLPAAMSDEQVLALLDGESQGQRIDRDLWLRDFHGLAHGNHVITLVSFEITGNFNVQRIPGQFVSTIIGAGLGDLTFDGRYEGDDLDIMFDLVLSNDTQFNPAGDLTGDGRISMEDWWLLGDKLFDLFQQGMTHGDGSPLVSQGTLDYYNHLSTIIPEPGTTSTLTILVILLMLKRGQARAARYNN